MLDKDEIARFDAGPMRADRREELIEWIKTLGIKPEDVSPNGVIVRGETSFKLHLSMRLRDENGRLRYDRAAENVVSEPLVIDLGTARCWPGWLVTERQG